MSDPLQVYLNKFARVRTLDRSQNFRDPLYRKPGESLDPNRFTSDELARRQKVLGPRTWGSLWMQNPHADGTGLFDRLLFTNPDPRLNRVLSTRIFDRMTLGLEWSRGYDYAFTAKQWNKPDPDFTVGVKMAFKIDYETGIFDIYISNVIAWRTKWNDSKNRIVAQAKQDGVDTWIGGEGNGPQSAALQDIQGLPQLALYTVMGVPNMHQDKSARAQLWVSRAGDGRVWLREGSWNDLFFEQGETYPNGAHDDVIDAVSTAYHMCAIRASDYSEPPSGSEQVEVPQFNTRW